MVNLDYGPGIGIVNGTFSYLFTIKLDENGYMKSMHWNVGSCNLTNDNGDRVLVIDSGTDTYGFFWDFWNNPASYNGALPIYFSVEDGWLDDIYPYVAPLEGTFANMIAKVMCKGFKYDLAGLMQFHVNANGTVTAIVKKGWVE